MIVSLQLFAIPDAQVAASEKEVFEQVRESMSPCNMLLEQLRNYRGAEAERRQVRTIVNDSHLKLMQQVISNPNNEEAERNLWMTLDPCIEKLKSFYDFSHSLGKYQR